MPPIRRPVLPGPRRTAQLPPLSLPPPSTRARRLPQIAPPPEDRDRAGHLASRMTPIGLIPVQAILAGASPDRTAAGPNRRLLCFVVHGRVNDSIDRLSHPGRPSPQGAAALI